MDVWPPKTENYPEDIIINETDNNQTETDTNQNSNSSTDI